MSLVSCSLYRPLHWQIARRASRETGGKLRPLGAPRPGSPAFRGGPAESHRRGQWDSLPLGSPSRLSACPVGDGPGHWPRLDPNPESCAGVLHLGSGVPGVGALGSGDSQGENPGREGASAFLLPASAALGLRSGGSSSKLRQVSTSSPRGGGRARHSEARTASAAWHRGSPVSHTPLMPWIPQPSKQPPETAPRPDWGGARRPQKDPPRSGPLGLRSAFNHFPAGSPPLTWHPAAAGKSGASRPPPLHSATSLSPGGSRRGS